eukprot:152910_1
MDDSTHINDAIYYGDPYTDSLIAMRSLSKSWWLLARMIIWPQFIDWTMSGKSLKEHFDSDEDIIKQICGYDAVSHVSKGVIGAKIEYSSNIKMNNIRIENLINIGSFGHENCDYFVTGSNYQGTHARGISIYNGDEIEINQLNVANIVSLYGPSYGIFIDKAVDDDDDSDSSTTSISVKNAKFSHIDAGIKASYDGVDLSEGIGYNWAAQSCAVYLTSIDDDDFKYSDIEQQCMNGHVYCNLGDMTIRNPCKTDADYTTPIGTFHITRKGDISAQLVKPPNNGSKSITAFVYKNWYFAVAIIAVLIILAIGKCVYTKKHREQNKTESYLTANEES